MDVTGQMLADAYEETVAEAMSLGRPATDAHAEGITAAAMFLASMTGVEDAAARAEVAKLGLRPVVG